MNNPMFALKGPKMADGEKKYATNFPLEHAQKDVRFAQALASEKGIDVTTSSAAHGTFKNSIQMLPMVAFKTQKRTNMVICLSN